MEEWRSREGEVKEEEEAWGEFHMSLFFDLHSIYCSTDGEKGRESAVISCNINVCCMIGKQV